MVAYVHLLFEIETIYILEKIIYRNSVSSNIDSMDYCSSLEIFMKNGHCILYNRDQHWQIAGYGPGSGLGFLKF